MKGRILNMRGMYVLMLAALTAGPAAAQQSPVGTSGTGADPGLRCTAFAISTGGLQTGTATSPLDIVIDRWSSEDERQQLLEALKRDQDALLNALRDLAPVGRIRTPTSLGWDLRYASASPAEDGERRIVIGTDRPMS